MADFDRFTPVSSGDAADGQLVGGAPGAAVGQGAAFLGDVNGDGIGDYLLTSSVTGQAWVVFGRAGVAAAPSLSGLNGVNGFRIDVGAGPITAGAVGDVNGDGLADIGIGDPDAGAVYVVYGRASGFAAVVDPAALTNAQGYAAVLGGFGGSIASAGDLNADGFGDIVIGASQNGIGGEARIIFGGPGDIDPFAAGASFINGESGGLAGFSVGSAGDINGDGVDDLFIGAPKGDGDSTDTGVGYVVFGHAGPWGVVDLAALDGSDGFRIDGDRAGSWLGTSVATGDINGDGIADIAVGAAGFDQTYNISQVYVVFGHAGPWSATLDLAARTGLDAVRFQAFGVGDEAGLTVAVADINGDGLADVVTSASGGNYPLVDILFGKTSAFAADFLAGDLNGTNGFFLNGYDSSPPITFGGIPAPVAAGDVNGDGAQDILVGIETLNGGAGGAAIVYGHITDLLRLGTAGGERLLGGPGADTLLGLAGKDILRGAAGVDLLDGGADNDILYGGAGADTLIGGTGADSLFGEDGDDALTAGDGADKLYGGAGGDSLAGGAGADRLEGGSGSDTLGGGAENDYLDGGAGDDAMNGGLGNDVFVFDSLFDQAVESAGQGYDIVRASANATLSANVEALELQGAAGLSGTGNAEANRLTGNSGDNLLSGLAGVDTILGGDGADTLIGGTGNDLLTGGAGADTFVVRLESLGAAVLETDTVYDFSTLQGDRLDLSSIDANGALNGDQAFSLVSAFGKHAGEMTLSFSAGTTLLRLDLNGDGKADFQMKINGDVTHDSGGWLL